MKVSASFVPSDLWVGAYWSGDRRILYVCPFPCVVLRFELGGAPPACHVQGCGRPAIPGLSVCAACRLSYLNGVLEAGHGVRRDESLCPACGHFVHPGTPCGWHGGSCREAQADPTLWCACDGRHPRGSAS